MEMQTYQLSWSSRGIARELSKYVSTFRLRPLNITSRAIDTLWSMIRPLSSLSDRTESSGMPVPLSRVVTRNDSGG